MSNRCASARTAFARQSNRVVKLPDAGAKIGVVLGTAILLIEALFRVNLAKHTWLVISQLALTLAIVSCLLGRAFRHRVSTSAYMTSAHPRSASTSAQLSDQRAGNVLARRGADYFGMSGSAEYIIAAALFVFLLILNVLNVLRPSFNSDEPQHLHVIWAWTRGFVQYRDIFDNHMPLFQIMFAPIFGLIGERATILYWMRFTLLPMYLVAAWCTYQIGAHLFSRRVGIWAILGVGFFSGYYYDAVDFRPNNLWLPIWLLCITVLVRGTLTVHRALAGGLLLGLCFGVSMKSTVFLLALLVGAFFALVLIGRKRLGKRWAELVAAAAAFLTGTTLVPAMIMIFFAQQGLWHQFRYDVFDFNFLADRVYERQLLYKSNPVLALAIFAMTFPIVVYVARWVSRVTGDPSLAFRRVFVLVACAAYYFALHVFWPPISRTYPPIYPLAFVLLTGALAALSNRLANFQGKIFATFRRLPLPAFLSLAEFFILISTRPIWKHTSKSETDLLRGVLALTGPSDYILDAKGETIFRPRCSNLILERITRKAIQRGLMMDDTRDTLVATHTCVVATIMIQRFLEPTRSFVEQHYVVVGSHLRVAGEELKPSAANPNRCDFNVVIPASYKIISRNGPASGTLDGTLYEGARFLSAGPHTFEFVSTSDELFLLWAQAVDRYFTPFARSPSSHK